MKRIIMVSSLLIVAALAVPATSATAGDARQPARKGAVRIRDLRALSGAAQAWFRPPATESGAPAVARTPSIGTNVDANNPSKDSGGGQSETAIAAWGRRVVVAWNDISGFMFGDTTKPRGSATGVGYSNDGGRTFTDLIGLRNSNPLQQWRGDPTVVAIDRDHFIVGSFYLPVDGPTFCEGRLTMAVQVLEFRHNGVRFSRPIVAVDGGMACDEFRFFPDKEFLSFDPTTRTLVMSYTSFVSAPPEHCGNGEIQMVRATVPSNPMDLGPQDWSAPIMVHPEEGGDCSEDAFVVNSGAYPAVAPGGDTYVAWERNYQSNLQNGNPFVYIMGALVPAGADAPSAEVVVSRNQTGAVDRHGGVKSLVSTQIVGFSRFVGLDFPRVAWDRTRDALHVVWNDASHHPLGDIFMKTLGPDLADNDTQPVLKVNDDNSGALHFLPAVSVRQDGTICMSWHDRRAYGASSADTDYAGECRADPSVNADDFTITTGPTNWNETSSLINPNFGDYTDNASWGDVTYYSWADGRLGVPQPFVDSSRNVGD